ncbi:MAG: low temperature requirement protein A [Sphingomonadales bacterium]|nr:low temperature requirement protein A [Sphingomonadales bacterium]
MSAESRRHSLLREHSDHAQVGYIELFFDLVYVFAVTQLSHHLLGKLDWLGALETLVLFFAVWWAWMYTTWATNWVDPEHGANRLMLGAVMVGSLVMSSTLPHAFDWIGSHAGLTFALAYVAVQVGRSLYVAWAMGEWRRGGKKTLTRISCWFAVSAVPWIIGGLAPAPWERLAWWGAALTIEFFGPISFYRTPWLGRSTPEDWTISGGHMAERCALFIIIALGEGVVIIGATFGGLEPSAATIGAFLNGFVGSFAMWWVYFDIGAKRGAEHIEHHDRPGLVGRNAFTYWHIPIVAGIIVLAVGDELTLAHPLEPVHAEVIIVAVVGIVLFLGGTMMFKRISSGDPWFPLSHLAGLWLTAALALIGWLLHPATLVFAVGTVAIFVVVALWEWVSFHGGWIARMERRGWWLGRALRPFADSLKARRYAQRDRRQGR